MLHRIRLYLEIQANVCSAVMRLSIEGSILEPWDDGMLSVTVCSYMIFNVQIINNLHACMYICNDVMIIIIIYIPW